MNPEGTSRVSSASTRRDVRGACRAAVRVRVPNRRVKKRVMGASWCGFAFRPGGPAALTPRSLQTASRTRQRIQLFPAAASARPFRLPAQTDQVQLPLHLAFGAVVHFGDLPVVVAEQPEDGELAELGFEPA